MVYNLCLKSNLSNGQNFSNLSTASHTYRLKYELEILSRALYMQLRGLSVYNYYSMYYIWSMLHYMFTSFSASRGLVFSLISRIVNLAREWKNLGPIYVSTISTYNFQFKFPHKFPLSMKKKWTLFSFAKIFTST